MTELDHERVRTIAGSLARDNGAEAFDQYLQTMTIWFALGTVGAGA